MKFRVEVMEFERGWGSKVDFVKDFDSADEAYKFQEEFNADNTESSAPDWYMQAGDPYRVA